MEIISSVQNQLIKESRKLQQRKYREEQKAFLIEGVRLAEEALPRGALTTVFYTEQLLQSERGQALYQRLQEKATAGLVLQEVTPQVLKTLAETESPQGIVAIARQQDKPLSRLSLPERALFLIADSLQDPGNLGTMIRTAWCAGADGVICLPGTVDPYNGKTVRASMGGIFNVPVFTGLAWPEVRDWCRSQGVQIVAGDLAGQPHYSLNYAPKTALVIGNEGQGLTHVRPEQVDALVTIPLAPGAESLNAAVACGILVYEIVRQRAGM